MSNQEPISSQLTGKDGPIDRTHVTRTVSADVQRCAVEVVDNSLVGFGINPGDVVIVILTSSKQLHQQDEGKLMLVQTDKQHGPLLRVAESAPCPNHDLVLYSGNQLYPVRGYKQHEIELLGCAYYFDRKDDRGRWEQFPVPENLLLIAAAIHQRRNHKGRASCDHLTTTESD